MDNMIKYDSDSEAWLNTDLSDLWVFDKLLLSKHLGYVCGPTGVNVPVPGTYIVRPCMNLLGMGIGARFVDLVDTTEHLPPGYFWCEVFSGPHLSVDYYQGKQILVVEGKRNSDSPLWKFLQWDRLDNIEVHFPDSLSHLFNKHNYINAEYIDGRLIELHFRTNPDFEYENTVAIPVWEVDEINVPDGYTYVSKPDYKRKGFYIK
jgi:hypothetical protein